MKQKVEPLSELQWLKVKELQKRSFHGENLRDADQELCKRAFEEDRERYRQNGLDVKQEYKDLMRSF